MEVFERYASARAQEAVAGAAARGQDPLRLRHDRAQGRLLRRHQHRVVDRARGRLLRHQRPQVVDVGHRRQALQGPHLHGQDRSPESRPLQAAVDDRGAARDARHQDRAHAVGVRLRRRAARAWRGPVRERPRARLQHAARRGPRLRDRPGPPGSRPHPPLHAADRGGRARAGVHVQARAESRGLRQAAGGERHHHRAHRPVADRDRPGAPPGAPRRLHDGHRRQQGGQAGHRRDQGGGAEHDAGRAGPRHAAPRRRRREPGIPARLLVGPLAHAALRRWSRTRCIAARSGDSSSASTPRLSRPFRPAARGGLPALRAADPRRSP